MSRRKENTPTRSKRELTKLDVLRLHLQGKKQSEIATTLKISQPTVARYLEKALQERIADAETDIAKLREVEVQKCDMREKEAWDAFNRSLKRDANGKATCEGDRAFLSEAGDAARDRAKLLGLLSANSKQISDERRARIEALLGIEPGELPE